MTLMASESPPARLRAAIRAAGFSNSEVARRVTRLQGYADDRAAVDNNRRMIQKHLAGTTGIGEVWADLYAKVLRDRTLRRDLTPARPRRSAADLERQLEEERAERRRLEEEVRQLRSQTDGAG